MKFLFKKTIDSFEIPTFLELDEFVLALTYRGCKPVCSFCKQKGHWKSDCLELEKFKQNKLKNAKKNSKSGQNTVGLALKTMFADINNKMCQKPQKKSKEPEDHTIAPQVKAIKDSIKPNKLQSLELNGKNDELISKKNIDRLTESNSTKQLDKIELELSDHPIYADSSCPSTPNFKKEWDKSDENYTENNVSVAVIDMDLVNELADNNGFTDA
ncbi:hypothetical protein BB561_001989 [Smittium simulii]|uniref:CCHC-type domain-containing protein n=1 Tax=Smittium simulii TaxID=133385 RepID=A0A2T9YS36_9FUNG|nr:hypothetical protein BB561_001989 [Smittium simulii]